MGNLAIPILITFVEMKVEMREVESLAVVLLRRMRLAVGLLRNFVGKFSLFFEEFAQSHSFPAKVLQISHKRLTRRLPTTEKPIPVMYFLRKAWEKKRMEIWRARKKNNHL